MSNWEDMKSTARKDLKDTLAEHYDDGYWDDDTQYEDIDGVVSSCVQHEFYWCRYDMADEIGLFNRDASEFNGSGTLEDAIQSKLMEELSEYLNGELKDIEEEIREEKGFYEEDEEEE